MYVFTGIYIKYRFYFQLNFTCFILYINFKVEMSLISDKIQVFSYYHDEFHDATIDVYVHFFISL